MTYKEYLSEFKKEDIFKDIQSVVTTELYSFIVGERFTFAHNERIATEPTLVFSYLHIFLEAGVITNEQINTALDKIPLSPKENIWLILLYIEAHYLYTTHRKEENVTALVNIDLDLLINKIKSVWEEYKDEYTFKYIVTDIYKIAGKRIFEE
jgi:hypothetical protein